jgi:hypothetical protein
MARWFTEEEVRRLIDDAVAALKARIAELEAEIAKLKKNSTTSSKPPRERHCQTAASGGQWQTREAARRRSVWAFPPYPTALSAGAGGQNVGL